MLNGLRLSSDADVAGVSGSTEMTGSMNRSHLLHGVRNQAPFMRFFEMCERPCAEGGEEIMRQYAREIAAQGNFEVEVDATGNLAMHIPGKGRGVGSEPVIIQFHADGVVAPKGHDFAANPMKLVRETKTVEGKAYDVISTGGTSTLMADNRAAGAVAFALPFDPNLANHPPLVILMTWGEETGLKGASALDPSILRGAKRLINLDNECLGEFLNACAGQATLEAYFFFERVKPAAKSVPVVLDACDFLGGHSGVTINQDRGSAITALVQGVSNYLDSNPDSSLQLGGVIGGSARNAIPTDASLHVWIDRSEAPKLLSFFTDGDMLSSITSKLDPKLLSDKPEDKRPKLTGSIVTSPLLLSLVADPMEAGYSRKVLKALAAIPHGVEKWEGDPSAKRAELSNNFAIMRSGLNRMDLVCMARHADKEIAKGFITTALTEALAQNDLNATVNCSSLSSGWIAREQSRMSEVACAAYKKLTGKEANIGSIHAGIECGEFAIRIPDIDQVSGGPTIFGGHTVEECLVVADMDGCYEMIGIMLEDLC